MKKLNLSVVTFLAVSTFAIAGGDIVPVEPAVEVPVAVVPVAEKSSAGFYIGGAAGFIRLNADKLNLGPNNNWELELDYITAMFQVGYKINDYIAVEGRYWRAVSNGDATLTTRGYTVTDDKTLFGDYDNNDVSAWAIYAKPMFPVTNELDIYALLGYANTDTEWGNDEWDDGTFSWGLGASYAITEDFSGFVDYVSLYNDETKNASGNLDITVSTINVGATYKF